MSISRTVDEHVSLYDAVCRVTLSRGSSCRRVRCKSQAGRRVWSSRQADCPARTQWAFEQLLWGPRVSSESLIGPRIQLRPLRIEDADELVLAAADGELWNLPFTVVPSTETVHGYVRDALEGRVSGSVIPFVTCIRETQQVIGSTRFWKVDRKNRKLEIGSTWLSGSWQGTFANTEAKYLMLRFAFEELSCVRVQFTTDETNPKSRAAILRLGAKEEGIIRHERIMPNGRKRNSVRYSIIDDEWPAVRQNLEQRLHASAASYLPPVRQK